MFLLKTNFKKNIIILLLISILVGTVLVLLGGYITDNYFSNMVSGLIGDYGEYDLLLTLAGDKEEIAVEQIENVIANTLPGAILEEGPRVAGSSNYLLKLPEEYKREEIYTNLNSYFSDVPGLLSTNIMTEPRLSIRGFRGNSLPEIRPLLAKVEGIDFIYRISDGLDIIVKRPELVPEVKRELNDILEGFQLLEIRYPLDQNPENLNELKDNIIQLIDNKVDVVLDVTGNNDSDSVTLLTSLKEMRTFLISYASKVLISDIDNPEEFRIGTRLLAETEQESLITLELIEIKDNQLIALIQTSDVNTRDLAELPVYTIVEGEKGEYLGQGTLSNPRYELMLALEKLNEITPNLDAFLAQSEQLLDYSENISDNLVSINQGLRQLEQTSQNLNNALREWQEEGLSNFLFDLLGILDEFENNIDNFDDIQAELIKTSNQLRDGAGMIEERLIFVPRSNSLYQDLEGLKELFLRVSNELDRNYDLIAERVEDMDPVIDSIADWRLKINSLLRVEDTLNSGADWQRVEDLINEIEETAQVIDTDEIQGQLDLINTLLLELRTTQLPIIIDQLSYIQDSLPDLEETEIVETINLIDSYIAGQVIPGTQIQLLLQGDYDIKGIIEDAKSIIQSPAVTYFAMDAGMLQPNPRGEVFNVLRQVRAVISTIIALIFTLFVLILDQSLIISVNRLNNSKGYLYSFLVGALIFSLICLLSQINFPYLNFYIEFIIGGILGLVVSLFAGMLNPVKQEEWEAAKALGFSPAEIMEEVIIPAGKPGLLYLLNYPKVMLR